MKISSEELLAQRELVKRHLDWLDARIAGAAGDGAPATAIAPGPTAPGSEAPAPSPVSVVAVDAILETHASDSGLPQSAKFGCVALAVLVVLGFLFVLFVLPQFLYAGRSATPPAEGAVVGVPVPNPAK